MRETVHVLDESLFLILNLKFHKQWTTLFHTWFLLGSYLAPTRFLASMAASKRGPLFTGTVSTCIGWKKTRQLTHR
jgi:hypothetical protein